MQPPIEYLDSIDDYLGIASIGSVSTAIVTCAHSLNEDLITDEPAGSARAAGLLNFLLLSFLDLFFGGFFLLVNTTATPFFAIVTFHDGRFCFQEKHDKYEKQKCEQARHGDGNFADAGIALLAFAAGHGVSFSARHATGATVTVTTLVIRLREISSADRDVSLGVDRTATLFGIFLRIQARRERSFAIREIFGQSVGTPVSSLGREFGQHDTVFVGAVSAVQAGSAGSVNVGVEEGFFAKARRWVNVAFRSSGRSLDVARFAVRLGRFAELGRVSVQLAFFALRRCEGN